MSYKMAHHLAKLVSFWTRWRGYCVFMFVPFYCLQQMICPCLMESKSLHKCWKSPTIIHMKLWSWRSKFESINVQLIITTINLKAFLTIDLITLVSIRYPKADWSARLICRQGLIWLVCKVDPCHASVVLYSFWSMLKSEVTKSIKIKVLYSAFQYIPCSYPYIEFLLLISIHFLVLEMKQVRKLGCLANSRRLSLSNSDIDKTFCSFSQL